MIVSMIFATAFQSKVIGSFNVQPFAFLRRYLSSRRLFSIDRKTSTALSSLIYTTCLQQLGQSQILLSCPPLIVLIRCDYLFLFMQAYVCFLLAMLLDCLLRYSISDLGAQFIRILFRFKQSFWLTKQLISEDYYEVSLKNVLQRYQINAKDIKTLTYDMVRNPKTNQLNVTAVFLVESNTQPNISPQILEPAELTEQFKSLINNEMSSVQLFAAEGSKIELVKQ